MHPTLKRRMTTQHTLTLIFNKFILHAKQQTPTKRVTSGWNMSAHLLPVDEYRLIWRI